jgi:hypothetical protein
MSLWTAVEGGFAAKRRGRCLSPGRQNAKEEKGTQISEQKNSFLILPWRLGVLARDIRLPSPL